MKNLVEALEAAEVGSRESDCALSLFDGFERHPPRYEGDPAGDQYVKVEGDGARCWPGHGGDQMVPHYTTSLDAIVGLIERKGLNPLDLIGEALADLLMRGFRDDKPKGPQLALALAASLLRALEPRNG
jgi:hypothetical protein